MLQSSTTLVTDATNGITFARLDCEDALLALRARPVPTVAPWTLIGTSLALVFAGRRLQRIAARRPDRPEEPYSL